MRRTDAPTGQEESSRQSTARSSTSSCWCSQEALTCSARLLVGTTMSARTLLTALPARDCTMGSAYASVFPLPVGAHTQRSCSRGGPCGLWSPRSPACGLPSPGAGLLAGGGGPRPRPWVCRRCASRSGERADHTAACTGKSARVRSRCLRTSASLPATHRGQRQWGRSRRGLAGGLLAAGPHTYCPEVHCSGPRASSLPNSQVSLGSEQPGWQRTVKAGRC